MNVPRGQAARREGNKVLVVRHRQRKMMVKVVDSSNKESSKRVFSVYESECVMRVLCVGQGFVVRKDMDHFSQLIHSMYTVHPHQDI